MRRDRDDYPIMEDTDAVGFNFHFQIATRAGRKACSIQVQAHNFHEATGLFRKNWPIIELMARDAFASSADVTEIRLTMPFLDVLTPPPPAVPLTTLTVVSAKYDERNAPADLIPALAQSLPGAPAHQDAAY
jgi:hypothetical protein